MPHTEMSTPIDPSQEMAQQGQEMAPATGDMTADMTDDDIAATLGFITTLSQQMMTPPEETVAEDEATEEEMPTEGEPQEGLGEVKDEIIGEISSLREDMVSEEMKQQFAEISAKLDALLAEEDDQDDENKEGEN